VRACDSSSQCIVFTNTSRKVDWLCEQLNKREFTVSSMHGSMPSSDRELVLKYASRSLSLSLSVCSSLVDRFGRGGGDTYLTLVNAAHT
jgi:translation initiation factor 4A